MSQSIPPTRRRAVTIAWIVLGVGAFAAAYGQASLYYSNQNQYFVHGLALAEDGPLAEDWLARTADPTPIFSALVACTARVLGPWAFHLYQGLLAAIYAGAMLGLFSWYAGPATAARRWPVFLALLIAVHAALNRWLSYRLFHADYPWYLQAGVAGQYVLGAMLQPSVFGVLLVLAVSLFVRGRECMAVVYLALAATFHSTYVLPAGLLTLGFLTTLLWERRPRRALALGGLALGLVLPITLYVLIRFSPTSPETFATAQNILVNVRIPHHSRPDLWLDPIAGLQVAWIVLALALVWRTRLFPVLAVPTGLAMLLTLAQVATGSLTLALLFPWRISAVLVPIATTVILTRLVIALPVTAQHRAVRATAGVLIALLAGAGIWISVARLAFGSSDEEQPLMDFVRHSRQPGDVYFLPVRVPDLVKGTYGSLSSDFKPVAEKKKDVRIIPVDLQRFRLGTGAPIFVDFKSIPYQDAEVIEWRNRLEAAEQIQAQIRAGDLPGALAALRGHGITHLVEPASQPLEGPGLAMIYADDHYRVYRLTPLPGAD